MFNGIGTALITPLNADKTINEELFCTLCKQQSENNVQAIFVAGTTGGGSTLNINEKIRLLNLAHKSVSTNVLIYMSISNNDTNDALKEITQIKSQARRVDGMLLLTPYYNKANDIGMYQHLNLLANHAQIPTILYHIPGRCGVGITTNVLEKLYQNSYICGIKYADSDINYLQHILLNFQNPDFKVYLGEDDLMYVGLKLNVDGYISAASNILLNDMQKLLISNEPKKLFNNMLPLIKSLYLEVNPIGVTYAYAHLTNTNATYRLPLCNPSQDVKNIIKKELETYDFSN